VSSSKWKRGYEEEVFVDKFIPPPFPPFGSGGFFLSLSILLLFSSSSQFILFFPSSSLFHSSSSFFLSSVVGRGDVFSSHSLTVEFSNSILPSEERNKETLPPFILSCDDNQFNVLFWNFKFPISMSTEF
jgi:hypothetical protein